jgi:hypothetical protein
VRELALEASRRGEDAALEFRLPANIIPGLIKLALHDFVILCGQPILLSTVLNTYFICYSCAIAEMLLR